MNSHRLFIVTTALLLAAACSSQSNSPTVVAPATAPPSLVPSEASETPGATEPSTALRIGQQTVVSGRTMSAGGGGIVDVTQQVAVRRVTVSRLPAADAPDPKKPANGYYVVVNVIIHEIAGSATINLEDFSAQSPDGTAFQASGGNAIFSGYGASGDLLSVAGLKPGQTLGGKLIFDVSTRHGTIDYAPGAAGVGAAPAAAWSF